MGLFSKKNKNVDEYSYEYYSRNNNDDSNNNFFKNFQNNFGVFSHSYLNKNILLLFVLLIVIIPFVLCLSLSFVFKAINNMNTYSLLAMFIVIGCYLFYLAILFFKYRDQLKDNYLWIFFMYIPIGYVALNIIGTIFMMFFSFADATTQNTISLYSSYVLQIIMEIIIVVIFEIKTKIFSKSIKKVFANKNILFFLLFTIVGVGLYFLFNYLFGFLDTLVGSGTSNNQESITSFATTIGGMILTFISAVLLAPIFEEIIYRYYFMVFTNYSWIGLLSTILMFAFAHVYQSGDFENIIPYFSLGIVNGLIIYVSRNTTPCIAVHFITNLIAFILMVV